MSQTNHSEAAPTAEDLAKWEHVAGWWDETEEELERNQHGEFRLITTHNCNPVSVKHLNRDDAVKWAQSRMLPDCLRGDAAENASTPYIQGKLEAAEKLIDALESVHCWLMSPDTSAHSIRAIRDQCNAAIKAWDEASQ